MEEPHCSARPHVTSAVDDFVERVSTANELITPVVTKLDVHGDDTQKSNENEICGIPNDFKGDIPNYDEGDEELNELLEEAKERNSDLLSDENELNMEDNVEFVDEFVNFVFNDTEHSEPKADDSKSEENRFTNPLFDGSPYTLGVVILLICCFVIRFRFNIILA